MVWRIFSALLALTALGLLGLLVLAWGYTAPIAYDPIGPRPYPILILSLFAACCLYLTFRPAKLADEDDLGLTPELGKKIVICMAAMMAYAVLFEMIGFPASTALMAIVVGRLFGGSYTKCIIAGVIMGVASYVLFDRFLDVPLPMGF